MYRKIKDVVLKTGQSAELGVVEAPDMEWAQKIEHLLGHKGEPWCWQIHRCLTTPQIGMETYCYILSNSGRPFANISTFESPGVGIFGHVYTVPEERKKGAADLLNYEVMSDFKSRGGQALYLGTTYDSPAYHIYRKHGFESVENQSGIMVFTREGKSIFEKKYFAPAPTVIEPLAFKHWPVLPALTMMDHPARLRVLGWKIVGPDSTEGSALQLIKETDETHQPSRAQVAVSKTTQALVALACWNPDYYFGSAVDLLDVFFAPGFESEALHAMAALNLTKDRKVICYSDNLWPEKANVLEAAGFVPQTTLSKHLKNGQMFLDVTMWARR